MRSAESLVQKEEPEFQMDIRIEGVAQDVIHVKMKKEWVQIQKKWLTHYELDTIPNQLLKNWGRQESPVKFSEELSGTIHELGNVESARVGTDILNRPVPILLEAHTGGIDFLLL